MIITVTMNPAIDKTVKVENIDIGGLNRVEIVKIEVGGKGINVARTIANLGVKVLPICFVSKSYESQIETTLKSISHHYQKITTDQPIRTNLKVITHDNQVTEFNEPGPQVSITQLSDITKMISDNIKFGDWLVLSGSVPAGVSNRFYFELINIAHSKQVKVILDADDDLLKYGLDSIPEVIKPNRYELEKLYQISNSTVEQLAIIASELVDRGIRVVVISLGEQGAIFADSEEILLALALDFEPGSTVGAGDAMVGALAVGLQENYNLRKLAAFCTASAAVSCLIVIGADNNYLDITDLSNRVIIKKLR